MSIFCENNWCFHFLEHLRDLPLYRVVEFQLVLSGLVVIQVSSSLCWFENEEDREHT